MTRGDFGGNPVITGGWSKFGGNQYQPIWPDAGLTVGQIGEFQPKNIKLPGIWYSRKRDSRNDEGHVNLRITFTTNLNWNLSTGNGSGIKIPGQ